MSGKTLPTMKTLPKMVLTLFLGAQAAVVAGTETENESATAVRSASTLPTSAPTPQTIPFHSQALTDSSDFRSVRLTDGMFGQPSSHMYKAFGVGMFIASGADLASTELGLRVPGVYELNPLMRNRNVRILSHVAAPAFMYWATDKLHNEGKTKLALMMRIGFNVAYSYVVMHNLRTAALQ